MNIAVISLKDLIKYIICFIVIISIIVIGIIALKKEEDNKGYSTSFLDNIKNSSFLYCLKTEIPIISLDENSETQISATISTQKNILETELAIINSIEEKEEEKTEEIQENTVDSESIENTIINETTAEDEEELEIAENLETQVIEENNINASYTNEGSNVKINNQTGYDITEVINNINYEIKNKDKIIIYHTHTCESYTSSESYQYEMTGTYRTTDLNYTVSRVGDELKKYLEGYGKTVIHDTTYHDYPAYNGSYGRSLSTMQNVLKSNEDAEIVIDLHRDAVRK